MINEKHVKRLCSEDISLIENYDRAVGDKNEMWDIHHRRETDEGISGKDLIRRGEYFQRHACELIFLPHHEHARLHALGRPLSAKTRKRMSKAKLGNKHTLGFHWWNNGIEAVLARECPPGFVKGRIPARPPRNAAGGLGNKITT